MQYWSGKTYFHFKARVGSSKIFYFNNDASQELCPWWYAEDTRSILTVSCKFRPWKSRRQTCWKSQVRKNILNANVVKFSSATTANCSLHISEPVALRYVNRIQRLRICIEQLQHAHSLSILSNSIESWPFSWTKSNSTKFMYCNAIYTGKVNARTARNSCYDLSVKWQKNCRLYGGNLLNA